MHGTGEGAAMVELADYLIKHFALRSRLLADSMLA
jgi:hypothetical protein